MPTQSQYNVCKQPIRNQTIKINLLNFDMQVVDELSGNCIGGSITIDSNADIRRTCNIELIVNDGSFNIQSGSKIWLNRYVQIYVGIDEIATGEIVWFNYGIYLIDAPSWKYDAVSNNLSFSGLDLMSKLTGIRNGYLEGIPTVISQGESVRDSMVATLTQLGGFNQYVIDECQLEDGTIQEVPYDIEINQGGTVYDILKELRDILPYYEIFFDENGIFRYQQIPTGNNEGIIADDDIFIPNVLSEQINTDFSTVKNVIEVYGKSHDIDNYSSTTTVASGVISCTIASITTATEGNMIGFTTPSAVSGNIKINVNAKGAKNLVNSSGDFITSLDDDTYYVAYYQANNTWLFLGHQQAYAIAQDDNPDSPFYIGGEAGIIRTVKYGGEYENIQSDELALARAEFEIYQACNLNNTITLNLIPIHWLDVNQIMSYTPGTNNVTNQYLIKSLSVSLEESGTQTINAMKYYPPYTD